MGVFFAVGSDAMYENKITKTFRNRWALLRGSFPAAFEFLEQLESKSAPVVWLHTSSNGSVYWQDGFLLHIKFIDIGEVNTGIRITPNAPHIVDGTHDRGFLLFPDATERLIRQHEGFRYRWAVNTDGDGFDLRHPAPSTFFRDLVALVERMGAQYRAAMNAEALEAELHAETPPGHRSLPMATPPSGARVPRDPPKSSKPAKSTKPKSSASSRKVSGKVAAPLVQKDTRRDIVAEQTSRTGRTLNLPTVSPPMGMRPSLAHPQVRESARPLDPRDTQRFLTFEHLVDAYFDYGNHMDDGDPLRDYFASRLEGLESLFLCRLPRGGRGARAASSDRGQVVELAWRCIHLHNSLESPFLAPVTGPKDTLIRGLWDSHGSMLGTPVEELRRACRATFRNALLKLFPGINDTVVGEADLVELGIAQEPPSPAEAAQ